MNGTTIDENSKQIPQYKDIVNFEPVPVMIIKTEKKIKLLKDNFKIIKALSKKNMTVLEIWNLFYDPNTDNHEFTRKTIYRHLEKLEKEKLVVVAGQRMTEGKRQTEKLFSRTARSFFSMPKDSDSKHDWYESEKGKEFIENTRILISEIMEKPNIDEKKFELFVKKFSDKNMKCTLKLIKKAEIIAENPDNQTPLVQVFSRSNVDQVNKMLSFITPLLAILRDPTIIEDLNDIFS